MTILAYLCLAFGLYTVFLSFLLKVTGESKVLGVFLIKFLLFIQGALSFVVGSKILGWI